MRPPDPLEPPTETQLVAVGYGPDRSKKLQIVLLADNGVRLGVSRKQARHPIGPAAKVIADANLRPAREP